MTERPGEMDERDVDERFASIVAGWDVPGEDRSRAGEEGDSPADGEAPEATAPEDGAPAPATAPYLVLPASAWRTSDASAADGGARAADAEEEHFEPPDVVLPPQEDLGFWGAVAGLVAGPLLLVYVAMVRPDHSNRWFAGAVALTIVGFALLVLRQPRHRDPSDPDDGARV